MREAPLDEASLRRPLAGRRVLLTGHTGFKGGWLALWLTRLGARVTGVALPPPADQPSLFAALRLHELVDHRIADLRHEGALAAVAADVDAELVIHMAAQPLVRISYEQPADTFLVNVVGTARVLDLARTMPSLRAAIVVTSDKCYRNREWVWGYRESDPMGGADPYSASKGCTELLVDSYRRSFFASPDAAALASVRAGNVIGGGDWSKDRLVPDLIRGALRNEVVDVRRPGSVRPWQHVLEPLAGYLQLAAFLLDGRAAWGGAWNFGPDGDATATVGTVVDAMRERWGPDLAVHTPPGESGPHEANILRLDSTKARTALGWAPRLTLDQAVAMTVDWYRAHAAGAADMRVFSARQIDAYAAGSASPPPADEAAHSLQSEMA